MNVLGVEKESGYRMCVNKECSEFMIRIWGEFKV